MAEAFCNYRLQSVTDYQRSALH